MTMSSEMKELAVVTGASTGIGAATAQELSRRGFHVIAGVRRVQDADAIRGPGIEPVILDITKSDHIEALVTRVKDDVHGRQLRALVNNAAVQANVPVEVFALDDWRRMFEVNLFGQVAVIQALLPALIRSKGRVVNISSVGGKVAMPTYGPYAATKFALEAVSDALRRELSPAGVQVVAVEPGAVQTEMLGRAIATARDLVSGMTIEQSQRYGRLLHAVNAQAESSTNAGLPAHAAALVIAKSVTTRRPRPRYTVGRDAAMITRLVRFVSDRMLDRILDRELRRYYPTDTEGRYLADAFSLPIRTGA